MDMVQWVEQVLEQATGHERMTLCVFMYTYQSTSSLARSLGLVCWPRQQGLYIYSRNLGALQLHSVATNDEQCRRRGLEFGDRNFPTKWEWDSSRTNLDGT